MGCSHSKDFDTVYTDYPKLKSFQEGFEKFGLTEREIGKFYEKFLQYEIDGTVVVYMSNYMFPYHHKSLSCVNHS